MSLLRFIFRGGNRSRVGADDVTSEQQYEFVAACIRGQRARLGAPPRRIADLRDQFPDISFITDPLARLGSALLEKSPLPLSEVKLRADLSSHQVKTLLAPREQFRFSLSLVTANGHEVDVRALAQPGSLDRIRRSGGVVAISIPGFQVRDRIKQYVADTLIASARAKTVDADAAPIDAAWPAVNEDTAFAL